MISVSEALRLVLEAAVPLPSQSLPAHQAVGRVLREAVHADIDSPPYDKSLMDGYAVRFQDLQAEWRSFRILEEVTAGRIPSLPLTSGCATRVMTGAMLPEGSDVVVPVENAGAREKSEVKEGAEAQAPVADDHLSKDRAEEGYGISLRRDGLTPGRNILRQGAAIQAGVKALAPGRRLTVAQIGLCYEMGAVELQVGASPSLAVLSTGDELVPPHTKPGPGQIRNSNGPMLLAFAAASGAAPVDLGIAPDNPASLRSKIQQGLHHDLLVLSGGVSAGVLDLAPAILAELGVHKVFHKIDLKPGKPLWFGVWDENGRRTLVFGLPGNPVSTLVCFELFVRPALQRMTGLDLADCVTPLQRAALHKDHVHKGDRVTYLPARCEVIDGQPFVSTLPWQGSADLTALAAANGLIRLERACTLAAGDQVWVHRLPS